MTNKYPFFILVAIMLCSMGYSQQIKAGFLLNKMLETADPAEQVPFIVKGDQSYIINLLETLSGNVKYFSGELASVTVPAGNISRFIELLGEAEYQYPSAMGMPLNDQMLINNNVEGVHQGVSPLPQAYDGEGVVIGFLDTGIEIEHPDFWHADSSTRIRYIWDQTFPFGPNTPLQYGFGQEWDSTHINAKTCPHVDPLSNYGHGSNVAGVGAGNGSAVGKFSGVAPKADIIAVRIDFGNNFLTNVADGIDYIFKKADLLGKPCVINASVGTYFGSHDGQDLVAQIIDNQLTAKSGRALVCAAGNAGNIKHHLGYDVTSTKSFTWFKYLPALGAMYFQLWADTSDFNQVSFSVGANKNNTFTDRGELPYKNVLTDLGMQTQTQTIHRDTLWNGNNRLGRLEVYTERKGHRYVLDVVVYPDSTAYLWRFATQGSGRFDVWSSSSLIGTSDMMSGGLPADSIYPDIINYKSPDLAKTMVSSWACSPQTITVANYNNRNSYVDYNLNTYTTTHIPGDIGNTSSRGPTRDNRQKPDISASGNVTLSTGSIAALNLFISAQPYKVAEGGMHISNGGTSIASPVVAGICALYLQRYPNATNEEMIKAITLTAKQDTFTGFNLPDHTWGFGKADALAALSVVKGCTDSAATNYNPLALIDNDSCQYVSGIPTETTDIGFSCFPNPASHEIQIQYSLSFSGDRKLVLYDLMGQKVLETPIGKEAGKLVLSPETSSSSIYFLCLYLDGQVVQCRKIFFNPY